MQLSFNSLVLIPSDHCNLRCRHCGPECGPTSLQGWDVPLFRQCLEDAAKIPNLKKVAHFAGGEPFLYFSEMLGLIGHAKSLGFASSVVTNGFWGRQETRAAEMISRLAESGLRRAEVSMDVFHQEHLPVETVSHAIGALKRAGVSVTLRVVTTRRHMVDETLRRLTLADLDGLEIVGSPVFPVGRARVAVPAEELYLSPCGADGNCYMALNLTVRPDGGVFPCCAGSEANPALSLGSVRDAPLDVIVRTAEWNFLVKRLVFQGPAALFPVLQEAGLGHKIRPRYASICHACAELFADPEAVGAIRSSLLAVHREALARQLSELFTTAPSPQ